jgi:hypothetical protein
VPSLGNTDRSCLLYPATSRITLGGSNNSDTATGATFFEQVPSEQVSESASFLGVFHLRGDPAFKDSHFQEAQPVSAEFLLSKRCND